MMKSLKLCLCSSFIIRLLFIYISTVIDKYFHLQYTDIDYIVITDASKYDSPYDRSTFRYSPIIAWLMIPNNILFNEYGKILFSFIDVICSYLIYLILIQLNATDNSPDGNEIIRKNENGTTHRYIMSSTVISSIVWIWSFNPLSIVLSTRGSFDTLSNLLLLCVILNTLKRNYWFAGLWYGLFIHFRLYPIIYFLSFFLYILKNEDKHLKTETPSVPSTHLVTSVKYHYMKCSKFILGTFLSAYIFTIFSYYMYKQDYINNAILYHLHRVDYKHNFSPHFYYHYLCYHDLTSAGARTNTNTNIGPDFNYFNLYATMLSPAIISTSWLFHMNALQWLWQCRYIILYKLLQSGVPIILITTISIQLSHPNTTTTGRQNSHKQRRSLILSLFLITLVFVTFNKVITAQVCSTLVSSIRSLMTVYYDCILMNCVIAYHDIIYLRAYYIMNTKDALVMAHTS